MIGDSRGTSDNRMENWMGKQGDHRSTQQGFLSSSPVFSGTRVDGRVEEVNGSCDDPAVSRSPRH